MHKTRWCLSDGSFSSAVWVAETAVEYRTGPDWMRRAQLGHKQDHTRAYARDDLIIPAYAWDDLVYSSGIVE
jgi:hypothetical protein